MRIPYRKPGKFSQVHPDPLMTEGKLSELQHQLKRLEIIQPHAAAEVARLAEMGDFSENAEYQLAKGRLRGINNRILTLHYQLDHAVIIAPKGQAGIVQVGHKVTIKSDTEERIYHILGSAETDPAKGIISHNSPIGAALIGRKVGEKIKITLAKKELECVIIKTEIPDYPST